MIDWLARANIEISQKRPDHTARTDETPVSSVSSVPPGAVAEKRDGVSSLSSVGMPGFSEKRNSKAQPAPRSEPCAPRQSGNALMTAEQADQCHAGGWNDAEIAAFTARRDRLMRWGYREPDAEALAERLTLRDREIDDRRVCFECTGFRAGSCSRSTAAGVSRELGAMAVMLQRCPAFVAVEVRP